MRHKVNVKVQVWATVVVEAESESAAEDHVEGLSLRQLLQAVAREGNDIGNWDREITGVSPYEGT